MTIERCQTVEDGAPRDRVDKILKHEGHVTEHLFIPIPIRHPNTHHVMRVHLIVRACQGTDTVTVNCEVYDPEIP